MRSPRPASLLPLGAWIVLGACGSNPLSQREPSGLSRGPASLAVIEQACAGFLLNLVRGRETVDEILQTSLSLQGLEKPLRDLGFIRREVFNSEREPTQEELEDFPELAAHQRGQKIDSHVFFISRRYATKGFDRGHVIYDPRADEFLVVLRTKFYENSYKPQIEKLHAFLERSLPHDVDMRIDVHPSRLDSSDPHPTSFIPSRYQDDKQNVYIRGFPHNRDGLQLMLSVLQGDY